MMHFQHDDDDSTTTIATSSGVLSERHIVIEVGRSIQPPETIDPASIQRISAVRDVDITEFGVLARQIAWAVEQTPPNTALSIYPSAPLVLMTLWAMRIGLHRRMVVQQWNGQSYDPVTIDPRELRDTVAACPPEDVPPISPPDPTIHVESLPAWDLYGNIVSVRPTRVLVIEIGRRITLPRSLAGLPQQRVTHEGTISPAEFITYATQAIRAIQNTPPDENLLLVTSCPLSIVLMVAMHTGLYRDITLAQWTGHDYEYLVVEQRTATRFFLNQPRRETPIDNLIATTTYLVKRLELVGKREEIPIDKPLEVAKALRDLLRDLEERYYPGAPENNSRRHSLLATESMRFGQVLRCGLCGGQLTELPSICPFCGATNH